MLVDCLQEWAPAKVVTRLFSFFKVCVRTRANVNEATRRWHKSRDAAAHEPDLTLSYVLLGPVKGGRGLWAGAQSLLVSTAGICGAGARREQE